MRNIGEPLTAQERFLAEDVVIDPSVAMGGRGSGSKVDVVIMTPIDLEARDG